MKFDKLASTAPTALSAEDIEKANRYEARMAKADADRRFVPPNPYMRAKIARLFNELAASVDSNARESHRHHLARPRDLRENQASQAAALDNLESLQDRYAEEPLAVSDEFRAKSHQMTRETAPDEEARI